MRNPEINKTPRETNMKYELYNSIDEMLAPETLSELEGRTVKYVQCRPFNTHLSRSGSSLLVVETNDGRALRRYLVKRVSLEYDWIMRVTEDRHCRSVTLWQSGLLDRLKPVIDHGIVACARDGEGWAILMRDMTEALLPINQQLSTTDNERLLGAMAAMHATYWNATELANPALGLCSLRVVFRSLSPETVRKDPHGGNAAARALVDGWELLFTWVEPEVADTLHQLIANPQPLCDALARYPQTIMHGDPQLSNLGLDRTQPPRTVMLDWQLAAVAPPTLDLYWYVNISEISSAMRETSIDYYRPQLAIRLGHRFAESDWQPMLELGRLAHLMRSGGWFASEVVGRKSEDSRANIRSRLSYLLRSVQTALKWL
jgi:hypothetical protein